MRLQAASTLDSNRRRRGFTLAETVMAIAVLGVVYGGVLLAYVLSARRAEWSGYSMAAQALSIRQIEQARAAKWDTLAIVDIDLITNVPTVTWTNLDIPFSGTNRVIATNYATISTIVVTNSVKLHVIQVDTVWPFKNKWYTNTSVTYRSPNQ